MTKNYIKDLDQAFKAAKEEDEQRSSTPERGQKKVLDLKPDVQLSPVAKQHVSCGAGGLLIMAGRDAGFENVPESITFDTEASLVEGAWNKKVVIFFTDQPESHIRFIEQLASIVRRQVLVSDSYDGDILAALSNVSKIAASEIPLILGRNVPEESEVEAAMSATPEDTDVDE